MCCQVYAIFMNHTHVRQYQWSNIQAYYVLDEILIAGELQESSKKNVARLIAAQVPSPLANINSRFP